MSQPKFQFQTAKTARGAGSLPDAVQKSLEMFQANAVENMKRGQGTVQATVTTPDPGAYFGIVLAGPFGRVEQMRRIGIE